MEQNGAKCPKEYKLIVAMVISQYDYHLQYITNIAYGQCVGNPTYISSYDRRNVNSSQLANTVPL